MGVVAAARAYISVSLAVWELVGGILSVDGIFLLRLLIMQRDRELIMD